MPRPRKCRKVCCLPDNDGFVYVGDKAPELCPVCKVPGWKFEKMEGRA